MTNVNTGVNIDIVKDVVEFLSEQYLFQYEQALENYIKHKTQENVNMNKNENMNKTENNKDTNMSMSMSISTDNKPKKEKKDNKKEKPAFILPFVGMVNENTCKGIKKNYDLHTQCVNKPLKNKDYCKTCANNAEKANQEKPPSGDIRDRLNMDIMAYVDPKGVQTKPYITYLQKHNISKEDAIKEAAKFGIVIPDVHFIETKQKQKRGRGKAKPKTMTLSTMKTETEKENEKESEKEKETETCKNQTDEKQNNDSSKKLTKKRGRPKKQKQVLDEQVEYKETLDDESETVSASGKNEISQQKDIEMENEIIHQPEYKCCKMQYKDEMYLLSEEDNLVFDIHTEQYLGKYHPDTKTITFLKDFNLDDDDDDDDENDEDDLK